MYGTSLQPQRSINLNILECKSIPHKFSADNWVGINLNILECKLCFSVMIINLKFLVLI